MKHLIPVFVLLTIFSCSSDDSDCDTCELIHETTEVSVCNGATETYQRDLSAPKAIYPCSEVHDSVKVWTQEDVLESPCTDNNGNALMYKSRIFYRCQ